MSSSRENNSSPTDGFKTGPILGFLEPVLTFPVYAARLGPQLGLQFSFCRGLMPYMICSVPSFTLQDGVTTAGKYYRPVNAPKGYDLFVAMLGGGLGAVLVTPLGNIIISQKKNLISPLQAIRYLYASGNFFRGFGPTAGRDAIYSGAAFDMTGKTKKALVDQYQFSPNTASILAGLINGVVASGASQWLDGLTSKIQGDPNCSTSLWKNIKELGIKKLHAGGLFRMAAICLSLPFVNEVSESSKQALEQNRASNKMK